LELEFNPGTGLDAVEEDAVELVVEVVRLVDVNSMVAAGWVLGVMPAGVWDVGDNDFTFLNPNLYKKDVWGGFARTNDESEWLIPSFLFIGEPFPSSSSAALVAVVIVVVEVVDEEVAISEPGHAGAFAGKLGVDLERFISASFSLPCCLAAAEVVGGGDGFRLKRDSNGENRLLGEEESLII